MSNFYGDFERVLVDATPKQEKEEMVCEYCGSNKIQEKHWVEVNTGKDMGHTVDDEEVYCGHCGDYGYPMTKHDYDVMMDEENEDDAKAEAAAS